MKLFSSLIYKLLALIFLISTGTENLAAQSKKEIKKRAKAQEVQKLIDSKNFSFKIQAMQPMRGGNRNVSGIYELEIKDGVLNSYLPYFGRAHTAPIDPSDRGLIFTTKDFSYSVEKKKKEFEITIIPKGRADYAREYNLSVGKSGYGSLHVSANNRDAISYTGYIEAAD